jgi:non-ribosomal peptide synthetase component F
MVFGEERLSYAEVATRADAIAGGLIARGIGPGDVVGLWMRRSAELLISQIAVREVGRRLAAVRRRRAGRPDRHLPQRRRRQRPPDERGARPERRRARHPIFTPQSLAPAGGGRADGAPRARTHARSPGLHDLHLRFDGRAEGHRHHAPQHLPLPALRERGLRLRRPDVVFQGASAAFDLSMEEIWIPLMVGATLVVASPAMIGDVERLPDF